MAKTTILFADNDLDFLSTRKEYLELEGYAVIPAYNPTETRRVLDQNTVDLAILDIRLIDDDDENDVSGLTLAKDPAYRLIPKVILTCFPSPKAVREALRRESDGISPAMDFVAKKEGFEAMLVVVRRVIRAGDTGVLLEEAPSLDKEESATVTLDVSVQLEKDYNAIRRHADLLMWARLALIVIGALVFVGGVVGVMTEYLTFGLGGLSAVSGLLIEFLASMFNKPIEDANRRWDLYHRELARLHKGEMTSGRKVIGKKQ